MRHSGIGRTAAMVIVGCTLGGHRIAAAERTPAAPAPLTSVTRRVLVSIPDRTLSLLIDDEVVRVYAVAVGRTRTPSPVGTFTIVNRVANPTYYKPGNVIGPGQANPIGTRWLGLSVKGYGIHGTDAPKSIGQARSHGCIRMRNRDVEQLFEQLRPGDVVELRAVSNAVNGHAVVDTRW